MQVSATFSYGSFQNAVVPMEVYVNLLIGVYQNYYNQFGTVPIRASLEINLLTVTSTITIANFSPPPSPPAVSHLSPENHQGAQ